MWRVLGISAVMREEAEVFLRVSILGLIPELWLELVSIWMLAQVHMLSHLPSLSCSSRPQHGAKNCDSSLGRHIRRGLSRRAGSRAAGAAILRL